jgi:hypothetical protein
MTTCHFCWTEFPLSEIEAHQATAHPGMTKRWGTDAAKGRTLTLIAADGAETLLDSAKVSAGYRTIRAKRKGAAGRLGPAVVSDADGAGAVDPVPPAIRDNRPLHRISQMAPPRDAVTRGAVEAAFSREFLAGMIVRGSAVLSEWDGAGLAGTFSAAEGAELAALLYDPTVSVIISRFGGNVDRFKLFLAGLIIAAGRGRVHAAAIARRSRERADAARAEAATETPERIAMHAAMPAAETAPEPGSPEYLAWLRAQQAAAGVAS